MNLISLLLGDVTLPGTRWQFSCGMGRNVTAWEVSFCDGHGRCLPAETHCGTRHAVPKGTHAVVRMLCFVGSGADAGQMSEQKREEMKQRKEAEANEKQRQEDAR